MLIKKRNKKVKRVAIKLPKQGFNFWDTSHEGKEILPQGEIKPTRERFFEDMPGQNNSPGGVSPGLFQRGESSCNVNIGLLC